MRVARILVLGLVAACAAESPFERRNDGLRAETFAHVLEQLVTTRIDALPDTAEYRRRRAAILQQAGVTETEMRVFAAGLASDTDLAARIYERVSATLDTLSVPPPQPPPDAD